MQLRQEADKAEPNKLSKRKHQISSLYHASKMKVRHCHVRVTCVLPKSDLTGLLGHVSNDGAVLLGTLPAVPVACAPEIFPERPPRMKACSLGRLCARFDCCGAVCRSWRCCRTTVRR